MLDLKSSIFVLTGPIGFQSFCIASVSYMGCTYLVEKVPVIGMLTSKASLGWRDGEVCPASLVVPQWSGMTQDSDKCGTFWKICRRKCQWKDTHQNWSIEWWGIKKSVSAWSRSQNLLLICFIPSKLPWFACKGLTSTWHSWCSSNGELLTLLLTYPRLYFSLLLYMLSMCLDGSSSSGWQTPMYLSRAILKSAPLWHLLPCAQSLACIHLW